MSDKKYNKEDCLVLLNEKYKELQSQSIERYPQRSDFSDREVVAIKAFLGPWPRALEAAGIKPPRDDDRPQRNKEKRARAKRTRIAALKKLERERKKNGGGAQCQIAKLSLWRLPRTLSKQRLLIRIKLYSTPRSVPTAKKICAVIMARITLVHPIAAHPS